MRPQYEKPADVLAERWVMEQICPTMCDFRKLPKAYQIDYGVYQKRSNKLIRVVEIKARDVNLKTYPTLILSAHKMHSLIDWYVRGVDAQLLYKLNDGLFSLEITTDMYQYNITSGGRTDRGDWQDVEPVYHIPKADLTPVHCFVC